MSNQDETTQDGLNSKPTPDALTFALDAVNDRWSLHVVRALALGARRYTEILRATGIPRDVLAARLRSLEQRGVLSAVDPDGPRRRGYELTQKGYDLGEVLLVLKRWGDTYSDEDVPRRVLVHRNCGRPFRAEVHCEGCGRPVRPGDLQEPG